MESQREEREQRHDEREREFKKGLYVGALFFFCACCLHEALLID